MQALRRRKLNTTSAAAEKVAPSVGPEPAAEPKPKRVRKPSVSKKVAASQKQPSPEPKLTEVPRGRKRKAPVVHEEPAEVPASATAAVMADAPHGTGPTAPAAPAMVWTREMLSDAAEQLKARDPGIGKNVCRKNHPGVISVCAFTSDLPPAGGNAWYNPRHCPDIAPSTTRYTSCLPEISAVDVYAFP